MTTLFLDGAGNLRSGWKALAFLAALGAANVLVYFLLTNVLGQSRLVQGPAGEVIPTLIILAVSWGAARLEGRSLGDVGFHWDRRWACELALGLLAGALLVSLAAVALRAGGGFSWVSNPGISSRPMLGAAWLFLFVAINEESTFRGYPFQCLVDGALGPWGTQLLFAGFFALVHWSNPGVRAAGTALKALTLINIALAALLLGLAYLRTRSLALPIGFHWAWNFTQGNLLGFPVSGTGDPIAPVRVILNDRPDWLTGGAVGLEGSLACTLVCLAGILALYLWRGSAPSGTKGIAA